MTFDTYADKYSAWLQSQSAYVDGEDYIDYVDVIDPTYEVTAFKQSTNVRQQITFHNAADDQVATMRSMQEISKVPSDFLDAYKSEVEFENEILLSTAQQVSQVHSEQEADKDTYNYYITLSKESVDRMAVFNPQRIL